MTDPSERDDDRVTSPAGAVGSAIRARIIRGDYGPGQRLAEEDMAAEHGFSRTSVREALGVLASQGFVTVQPYFGTFVGEMTPKEAADLIEVQGALEPLAAGLAAGRRTWAQVADLRAIVAEGQALAEGGRGSDVSALHGRFHALLGAASGNEVLAELMVALHDKLAWAYASNVHRPLGESWAEHAEIVDAVERGDAVAAIAAGHAHIEHAAAAQQRDASPGSD